MSGGTLQPTPGIERMDRKIAERHFAVRLQDLARKIRSLPTDQVLLLAFEMRSAGVAPKLVLSVAQFAVERLERELNR